MVYLGVCSSRILSSDILSLATCFYPPNSHASQACSWILLLTRNFPPIRLQFLSIQSRHHHYPFLRAINQSSPLVSLFILHFDWVSHWPLLAHSNWGATEELSSVFIRATVLSLSPASGGPQLAQESVGSLFPAPQLALLTFTTLLSPPCSSSHLLHGGFTLPVCYRV